MNYANLSAIDRVIAVHSQEKNTKIGFVARKLQRALTPIIEGLMEELEEIRIDNCVTDADGTIKIGANGSYQFSKEGLKEINKKNKELFFKEIKFTPISVSYVAEINDHAEGYLYEGWVEGIEKLKEE